MRRPSVPLSRLLAVMAAGGWLLLAAAQVPAAAAPAGPSVAAIAVDRVRDAAPAAPASHTGTWVLLAAAALAAGAATLLVLRRGRLRQEQAAQAFSQVRAAAEQDLAALGTDVRELELDLDPSPAGGDATADYTVGVDWYQWASEAFDRAATVADFAQVSAAVEASGLALARARARLDGRPTPQRRPPCFFDPRHGPSVRDVAWAPPGGTVRPVPACAACAGLAEHGSEPLAREVLAGDQPVPLWAAPAPYAAWFAGHYGAAAGGLLTGLPLGEAVAAGWSGWSGGPGAFADTGVLAGGTPVGGDPARDLGGGRP